MLQKAPGNRYPTAEALADDLRRFRDGKPIEGPADPPVEENRAYRSGVTRCKRPPPWRAQCILLASFWYLRTATDSPNSPSTAPTKNTGTSFGGEEILRFMDCWRRNRAFFPRDRGPTPACTLRSRRPRTPCRSRASIRKPPSQRSIRRCRLRIKARSFPTVMPCSSCWPIFEPQPDPEHKGENFREALRLLEAARKLGVETRAYHQRHRSSWRN